jgi:hypothetical protein
MSENIISNVMNPKIDRVGGLNETAFLPQSEYSMAERPGSLDNKTVYLIDTGFGGSSKFMIQLQKYFADIMPSVKTIRKKKPENPFMGNTPELWDEIREKGDAAVLGVAG